jgi:DNA-binding SARP family transcriptional activator/tetratricopeptide (TPR) repeat protein
LGLRFSVLGPVEAHHDGRVVDLGPARQRYVLAALLIDANQVVPPGELASRVWGENTPARAAPTLRSYMSRLRSALSTVAGCEIHRRPGGYLVQLDEDMVDVHRFRRLVADARDADDGTAAGLLRDALGLWRGPAIAELETPWAARIRDELHADKFSADLDYCDVQLRRGEHASVLVELTGRAERYPLDERLARQLLLALYRSGRQAEALQRYEEVRRRLAEELGADPSPALQQLHRQMLTAAPALDAPSTGRASGFPVPRQLPAPPAVFIGRAAELAALDAAVDPLNEAGRPISISAVGGCGGIGKTCLALHWAHRNLSHFPDGQLYANLRGFDDGAEPVPPEVVIRGFLDALGVASEAIPATLDAQAALYRSLVAGKRLLVLLDNARDTNQVVPLLPGSPTCMVIVTSRQQLSGLLATHGARPVTLDVLPAPEARDLLAGRLGHHRLDQEPDATDDIVCCCSGLPLALSIVAARASTRPTFPLTAVAEELRDTAGRLDALDAGDPQADLRTVFSWSYHALSTDAARLFRLLGLHAGPDITLPAAASLAGVTTRQVRPLVAELARASLLTEHCPGRFVLHDLLRAYAGERSRVDDTDAERHEAAHRALDHYLQTGHTARQLFLQVRRPIAVAPPAPGVVPEDLADLRQAATWFDAEHRVILAAIRHAADAGFEAHSWQLAWTIAEFLDQHGHWHDYATAQHIALAAAQRLGSREGQANAHRGLARACTRLGAYADAQSHLRRALDLHRELGDRIGQAFVHMGFGRVLHSQGHHAEALAHVQQALDLYRGEDDHVGQVDALNGIGMCHAELGNYQQTLAACTEALALARETDAPVDGVWDTLGFAHHRLGDHSRAIACFQRSLSLARDLRDVNVETEALRNLGDAHRAAGDVPAARASWQQALAIHEANDQPRAAETIRRRLRDLVPAGGTTD